MENFLIGALVGSSERHYEERIRIEYLRDSSNPFNITEWKFRKLFRIPKSGALYLLQVLESPNLNKGHIPKHLKVLTALQFFAQGSYQTPVGPDNFLGLSQPAVSRCLKIVTKEIIFKITPVTIKFPSADSEKESAKREFLELFNFPNTLGALDGTHVAIAKPPINHPTAPGNLFYNRKGFYSINCQIICSAKGKIIALNPNFPGSTHDAAIWRASRIYRFLKNKFVCGERNQWLLGDKGYPLQPWLMTPLLEPNTAAEENYNKTHCMARNIVEMCIGRLKNKFRCLHRHRCLHYEPQRAAEIILSCATLYNMFISELSLDDDEIYIDTHSINTETETVDVADDFLREARIIRESLINTHFTF